ncbi:transposase [Neptuniibacter pectenicola]|uniref:transposase n=1 Tax=Neptuniibacter pectenicola TaxID=1806669 RepID=UPI00082C17C6|nr:transposase [Neptuniibacter pectenicola]
MTRPRKELVSVQDTPYYHIVSRCVRRSFLCGLDHSTGKDYEHRRQWIEDRIRILSSLFSIDICAYAVMSNHLHIVIKLCPAQAQSWSNTEVIERWLSLFKGPLLIQQWQAGESLSKAQLDTVSDMIEVYRERLASLSWFMKCLNEPIARQANQEDKCTGHFWESRYKSQALLTEEALLSCMAYVDLNPVRAGMAATPEESDHTSIKERIKPQFDLTSAIESQKALLALQHFKLPVKPFAKFEGSIRNEEQQGILFSLEDYLTLVDMTGRILRDDKRGAISAHLPPILERLEINQEEWLNNATQFERLYHKKFARKRRHNQAA